MFLKRLYSEPTGLFNSITFIDGINFIYGKKDRKGDPKKSLNGIGKSTLLDLLDFCLLSSFQEKHNPRLSLASPKISSYKIVLEFEVNGQEFIIKRNTNNPNEIEYGQIGAITTYPLSEAKSKLFILLFSNREYPGKIEGKWFRTLMLFFLKIQKHKTSKFLDPIQYIKEMSTAELNQVHLYLMNIDNSIVVDNFKIQESFKRKIPALREVKNIVETDYALTDIKEANNEINKLKREVEVIKNALDAFKLGEQYQDAEQEANKLTEEIKALWYQNYSDRDKINSYLASLKTVPSISKTRIGRIYSEFNQLLGEKVKKSLEEVIEFNKELAISRENFMKEEIDKLKEAIRLRENSINSLEEQRTKLFNFLSTKGAINDLTEAFYTLNIKKNKLSDLEAKLKTYNTLQYEILDLEKKDKDIAIQVKRFIDDIQTTEVSQISGIFNEIYNAIYPETKEQSVFTISDKLNTDAKLEIGIDFPDVLSKGKNKGRTLVYDLTVLFNAIKKNIPVPRFLVHDGIFDGMDKAHFVSLYTFLEQKKKEGNRFQYILTLNEEGTLSHDFGDTDQVSSEKIEQEAVAVYTPTQKLFKFNF